MQFEFYHLQAGPGGAIEMLPINAATLANAPDDWPGARAAVEERFRQLVSSNPRLDGLFVVWRASSAPAGVLVAAEQVFTATASPDPRHRRLHWLTEEGIPI